MGTEITDLFEAETTSIDELRNSTFTVDAHNILYQFLTTIRQRDGSYLTDSNGNVTSHLVGLFNRMTRLMMHNMNFIYCFDGDIPDLKQAELDKRKQRKEQARKKYETAKEEGDTAAMKKYSRQSTTLKPDMIDEAKELITALGQTWVQAPSEGEAQASHIVTKGDADAVISQDGDCFLFNAPHMVKNLTITGRRKRPGKHAYTTVEPELLSLHDNLERLDVTIDDLRIMAVLIGTDYNDGIHGVGPKTALKLVRKHDDPDTIFHEAGWDADVHWQTVLDTFTNMPTTDDYTLEFNKPNHDHIHELLVNQHNFSKDNVQDTLDELEHELQVEQKGLGDF